MAEARLSFRVHSRILVLSVVLCLCAGFSAAGNDAQGATVRGERDAARNRVTLGEPPGDHEFVNVTTDPEKTARQNRESDAVKTRPAPASTALDEDRKRSTGERPRIDARKKLLADHDWDKQFEAGGPVSDALQLSLGVSEGSYRWGTPFYFYLGLKNHRIAARTLTVRACGSLARSDELVFRIRSDDGTELEIQNRFFDKESVHPHPLLHLGAGDVLVDLLDLNDLAATSGRLFDLVRVSQTLTITPELPALSLKGNPVTVQLAR